MKPPSVESNPQKIDRLERRIKDGDIKIPAFQRGYVWKQEQIIELLESIVNEYPVGSVLLWEVTEKNKLKCSRNIAGYSLPEKSDDYPIHYVLDGQQRISSIFGVFSDSTSQDTHSKQYNPNTDIFEIYYDFKESKFLPKKEVDLSCKHIFYLRNLLNNKHLLAAASADKFDQNYMDALQDLQSKFLNYEIPVVTIKNRDRADVAKIFERINNTGTKLNLVDLMTAWTWTEDFHLLDAANDLQQELNEKGFGKLSYKLILQIASSIISKSTTTDSILNIEGISFRNSWDEICESIRRCIDFLSTELNCRNIDFLPFNQQVVPLCYFFSINSKQNPEQVKNIKRWFWATSFSDRYSTGRTTSKMDYDLSVMNLINEEDFTAVDKYSYTVTTQELIQTQFSKTNPLTRSMLLLMAQSSPIDLISGKKIDLESALSNYNRKEYHHVFPNAYLSKLEQIKSKRFSLMNFCFLTSSSNKSISSKKPSEYFEEMVSKENFSQIMESNLLPGKREIYTNNDFEEFLKTRATTVMSKIDVITS